MKIAFEEHGSGPPVVLLHAFPLDRKMWRPQIEAVTSVGFRLILPDLRGFGESVTYSSAAATDTTTAVMDEMAADVAELLDSVRIERAIVGGLSMGGYVAFSLYRMFPERFAALILCDTNAAADTEEKRRSRFELIEEIEKRGVEVLIEKMLPNLISEQTNVERPDLVEEIRAFFSAANPLSVIAALRGLAARRDHTFLLDRISKPTLLIFGAEDNVTNLETAVKMNALIPLSRFVQIAGAGHYSSLERPDEFNRALIPFLKTVEF